MSKSKIKKHVLILIAILGLAFFISLSAGSKYIEINKIFKYIFTTSNDFEKSIIDKRIVRGLFAILAGIGLGQSACLIQSVTQNKICDSGILGINSASGFFVVLAIAFLGISTFYEYLVFSFLGAIVASILLMKLGDIQNSINFILAGSFLSVLFSSLTSIVMLPRQNVMDNFRFWQVGSLSAANFSSLLLILPLIVIASILSFYLANRLDTIALGDDLATGLGIDVVKTKFFAILAAIILSASITAIAGPISFIGFIAVNISRKIIRSTSGLLLMSALIAAIILIISDSLGRILSANGEVEVGILIAMIGGPLMIYIVLKEYRK